MKYYIPFTSYEKFKQTSSFSYCSKKYERQRKGDFKGKKKENFIKFQPILFCDTAEGLC